MRSDDANPDGAPTVPPPRDFEIARLASMGSAAPLAMDTDESEEVRFDPLDEAHVLVSERYAEQLGSLDAVPRLAVPFERLQSLSLGTRATFLLSLTDGRSSLALILDVSGIAASKVLGTFAELVERGIITLRR
jgi:hypothetical protein